MLRHLRHLRNSRVYSLVVLQFSLAGRKVTLRVYGPRVLTSSWALVASNGPTPSCRRRLSWRPRSRGAAQICFRGFLMREMRVNKDQRVNDLLAECKKLQQYQESILLVCSFFSGTRRRPTCHSGSICCRRKGSSKMRWLQRRARCDLKSCPAPEQSAAYGGASCRCLCTS